MKLIFAGTPEFAAVALEALLRAGHQVELVLTQPDRRAGRGLALEPSPVKKVVQKQTLNIFQPESLKDPAVVDQLAAVKADAMVVAAYGLIIPAAILSLPRWGCFNIHASLLPRWRGAAPIHRAILAGDTHTGVTIMQMDAGLDTGDMLLRERIPIASDDTTGTLHDKLAPLGARLMVAALADVEHTRSQAVKQDPAPATYAAKISKSEATIDWKQPAVEIERKVRAFNPAPGAASTLGGSAIKFWRALAMQDSGAPGTVLAAETGVLVIACGVGALRVDELQRAGGKRLATSAFLAGSPLTPGVRFGS